MGKAFSGGGGQKNYANEMAQTLALISNMQYNKERSAYYGEQKESEIASRQANVDVKREAEFQKERERQFESATGRKYEPGDEAYMGGTGAAIKALQGTPVREGPRTVGGGPFGIGAQQKPGGYITDPETGRPFVKRDVTPGEPLATGPKEEGATPGTGPGAGVSPYAITGLPSLTGQKELQKAQTEIPQRMAIESYRRAQTLGMTQPYLDEERKVVNPNYNPEIIAQIRQGNVRPDELVKRAEDIYKMRGERSRTEGFAAETRTKETTATIAERNLGLMQQYAETDDPRIRRELVRQVAVNNGHGIEAEKMDEDTQKTYAGAANAAAEAMSKLQETQTKTPKNVDLIAQQAQAVTAQNMQMSRIANSPMTKIATMTPYQAWNPLGGIKSQTTLINAPTEFARAHTDGTLEALIRAPINPDDPDTAQYSQMSKQGKYFGWKLIQQNPELMGHPEAFNRAVDQSDIVAPHVKLYAKQHMGLYMAANPGEKAETNVSEADKPQGPTAPPQIALPKPKGGIAGFEPPEGPAGFSPKDIIEPIKKFLPKAPAGGMFGTDVQPDAKQEPRPTIGPPSVPGASAAPVPQNITPRAPLGAPQSSNKSLIDAVIKQESSGNPNAVGSKGEVGLMQLRPAAAKEMGLSPEDRSDPVKNRAAGTAYLEKQIKRFGDTQKALAAYNWGPDNVEKAIAKYGENWMSVAPESTKKYIRNIMANMR